MEGCTIKTMLTYLIAISVLVACQEDASPVQGFSSREVFVNENETTQNIILDLGEGLTEKTNLTITISGTAGLDGDFFIEDSNSAIKLSNGLTKVSSVDATGTTTSFIICTVLPGQKTITLPIKLIDDIQIETGYEAIQLNITNISNAAIEIINKSFSIFISDNDFPSNEALQIDLSWQLQSGGSVNGSNFDLFLVKNVTFTTNAPSEYDLVSGFSSAQLTGFETIVLNKDLLNDKYYALITYVNGNSDTKFKAVISQVSSVKTAVGQVAGTNVGERFFFGPIYKTDAGFTY